MPRVKQFNRDEVLEKAMHLFWRKGFHATSMQDLVSELKINRASLYDTFGGKCELFEESIARYRDSNTERVIAFFKTQENVREGLYKLFENSIDSGIEEGESKGCFVANATTELANSDERIGAFVKENKQQFEKIYADYLRYGVEQGQISPYKDIEAIAVYLNVLLSGIQVVAKTKTKKEELMKIVKTGLSILN